MTALATVTSGQRKLLIEAVSRCCEWCGIEAGPDTLEIHLLPTRPSGPPTPHPQKRVLVLCRECHSDLHRLSLPYQFQMDLVRVRKAPVKRAMRAVFGYTRPQYEPPLHEDIEAMYEECFSLRSLDLFRAGG